MSDLFQVSSSPHVRSKVSTDKIMLLVVIALMPSTLFGIYNFGFRAAILIIATILSCVVSEFIFDLIVHKENTINDLLDLIYQG